MTPLLSKMVARQKIPHALLFVGDILTAQAHALQLAAKVLQEEKIPHPDVHHYYPEGKVAMHSILSMRSLREEAELTSYYGKGKFFLLHYAERMFPTSSNLLLKLLEEPPPATYFILLAQEKEEILPTLLSRCQEVHFPEKEIKSHEEFLRLLTTTPFSLNALDKLLKKSEAQKEEEGLGPLRYQEEITSCLLTLLTHLRTHRKEIPLYVAEQEIRRALLALKRSIPAKTIIEALLIRFGYL